MDKVTVIQADREAAAANIKRRLVWQHGGEQPWMDAGTMSMRMGEQDDHDEVQAFAAHRLATPAPDSEKLREEVKRMEQYSVHVGYDNRGDFVWEDCVSRTEVLAALGASL